MNYTLFWFGVGLFVVGAHSDSEKIALSTLIFGGLE